MVKPGDKVKWKGSDDVLTVVSARTSRISGLVVVRVRDSVGGVYDINEKNLTPAEDEELTGEDKITLSRSDFYGIVHDVETALFGGDDD